MRYTKVHWLLDGVVAQTHPHDWGELLDLSNSLISLIGNKELQHIVVDPIGGFQRLSRRLIDLPVSTIIDISHWFGLGLRPLFPNAEIVTDFSISRIMDVSAIETKTAGFVISTAPDEVKKRAQGLDLSKVLIIDDATVSGRTNTVVMDIWGLNPRLVTHASLIANVGDYPKVDGKQKKRGARVYLEGMGGKVLYGDSMISPQEEAEHMQDIFQYPQLERFFSRTLDLQLGSDQLVNFFPDQFSESNLARLADEGRFVRNPEHTATENSLYIRNPSLWTYKDFGGYLDIDSLQKRGEEVLFILDRFKVLTRDPSNIAETRQELVRVNRNLLENITTEGNLSLRERLAS